VDRDINGVIAGNDEMALGAIQALKDAGKLSKVKVLGFDGNDDAAKAVLKGQMVATALQPIVTASKMAVDQADHFLKTGKILPNSQRLAVVNKGNYKQAQATLAKLIAKS